MAWLTSALGGRGGSAIPGMPTQPSAIDLEHIAVLIAFALVVGRLALWRPERRLID